MTRAFRRRQWLRNLLFVAAAGAIGVLSFGERGAERLLFTAVDAQDAAALCAREGVALSDFWQRAEAMGLGGVVVREEPLGAVARKGRLLLFSRDEVEKWRAAGLVSPSVPLKADTLWIKDPAVADEVLLAAQRYGVAATTSALSGLRLVHFPETLAASGTLADAPLGLRDPDVMRSLEGRRLARVFLPAGAQAFSAPVKMTWTADGSITGAPAADGRLFEPRWLPVDASPTRLLLAAYSLPSRLLVFRLGEGGVDANFDRLRARLQELKSRGLPAALPARPPSAPPEADPLQRRLIALLLGVFGVVGPLLAARGGLTALKRSRVLALARLPDAAPVLQIVCGLAAAAAGAAVMGLAARACFDSLGILEPSEFWSRACLVAPLFIALLTLYTIDPAQWRAELAKPMTWAGAVALLALSAAALVLLEPRAVLAWTGLQGAAARLKAAGALPWWWSWRWREVLVGWPCLLQALFLINWRMDCPDCASLDAQPLHDPRSWFVLGLFAPIGAVIALGQEAAPRELALAQTGWAALAGCLLGAVLVAARLRGLHGRGTKGPEDAGTIDLEAGS